MRGTLDPTTIGARTANALGREKTNDHTNCPRPYNTSTNRFPVCPLRLYTYRSEIGKKEKRMTQRMSPWVFYRGCIVLMALAALPVAHAQQTANVSSGAWQPHRPDNQPKQKEAISGGACLIQSGAFPVGFNAYVVPNGDHPSYPPFCSPVPAGPLNLVIDILAPHMRDATLAVRLMKTEGGDEREILTVPA